MEQTHAAAYQATWSVARAPDPFSSSTRSSDPQQQGSKEPGRGADTRSGVPSHVVRRTHTRPLLAAAPAATPSSKAARSQDVEQTHAAAYQATWSVARTPDPFSSSTRSSDTQQQGSSKEPGRGADTRSGVPSHVVRRTHT